MVISHHGAELNFTFTSPTTFANYTSSPSSSATISTTMLSFQNHPNATTQDINKFLSQIQIPGWRVHPKLVEFNDPADRDRKASLLYNKYKKTASKPDPGLEWEDVKETVELVLEDVKQADIISSGVHSMRQSGSIAMICGDWERDLAQELGPEENIDHIVLVFLKNRQVRTHALTGRETLLTILSFSSASMILTGNPLHHPPL